MSNNGEAPKPLGLGTHIAASAALERAFALLAQIEVAPYTVPTLCTALGNELRRISELLAERPVEPTPPAAKRRSAAPAVRRATTLYEAKSAEGIALACEASSPTEALMRLRKLCVQANGTFPLSDLVARPVAPPRVERLPLDASIFD